VYGPARTHSSPCLETRRIEVNGVVEEGLTRSFYFFKPDHERPMAFQWRLDLILSGPRCSCLGELIG